MSARVSEKQRRQAEREARQLEEARRTRRDRRLRLGGIAAVALLAGIAAVVAAQRDRGSPRGAPEPAFDQHYAGLEERRLAAGVSTMSSPTADTHTHPQLSVWIAGKRILVPANVGVDPSRPPGDMAGLHTHTPDGIIHNEGQATARLGQFFAIWGVPLSATRLGPYRAGGGKVLRMWVDGRPSRAFGSLLLRDRQKIVLSFGRPGAAPPPN